MNTGFTRTRGGDPDHVSNGDLLMSFYPHTRGRSYGAGAIFTVNTGFPRTRGGDPGCGADVPTDAAFYPHTRG
ncbi:hypothetical protein [Streptococcus ratti]|uniref:hypothetical protein n=1 Tax=Streptococcus ratti TaxID=1341 RepID=UPI00138AC165